MLSEETKIVGCLAPVDSGGVAKTGQAVGLGKYDKCTLLVYVGNVANDQTLTVEECSTAAGADNVAIAFNYRKASAGAAAKSVLNGALTAATAAGITIANATDDNKIIAVEIKASELSATKPYVRALLSAGAVALDCIIAILSRPRYAADADTMPDPTS